MKRYIQGRYRCQICGDFNYTRENWRTLPDWTHCPKCNSASQLLDHCHGRALAPEFNAKSEPRDQQRDLPGSWYNLEGEHRGVLGRQRGAAKSGRKRDGGFCEQCHEPYWRKRSGAMNAARKLELKHPAFRYVSRTCPHNPKFHHVYQEDYANV